jgi:hypothetical protein
MSRFADILAEIRSAAEGAIPGLTHSTRYEVFFSPSHSGTDLEYVLLDKGSVGHGPQEGEAMQRDETRRLEITIKHLTRYDIKTATANMVTIEETLGLALIQKANWTTEIWSITKESSKSDTTNKAVWYNTLVFDVLYRYP